MKPTKPTTAKKYYYPEYQKEYYQRPEVKERQKEYNKIKKIFRCKSCGDKDVLIEYVNDINNPAMGYEITKCKSCGKAEARRIQMDRIKLRNLKRIFSMKSCPINKF